MAHGHKSDEKIVYVGDSRVIKKSQEQRLIPKDYSAYSGKSEAFIPNFLLKEWMVGVVVLVGMLVLVMSDPAPLGYPADPKNTAFIPMPDWYFLFMYQLLKYPYTSGNYVVLGAVVVPGLLFGGLLLAPFLDTGKERRFYRRPIASSLMILSLVACTYLTYTSWSHYQVELKDKNIVPEHIKREEDCTRKKVQLVQLVAAVLRRNLRQSLQRMILVQRFTRKQLAYLVTVLDLKGCRLLVYLLYLVLVINIPKMRFLALSKTVRVTWVNNTKLTLIKAYLMPISQSLRSGYPNKRPNKIGKPDRESGQVFLDKFAQEEELTCSKGCPFPIFGVRIFCLAKRCCGRFLFQTF